MVAFAPLAYLVAAICFIMALRGLSSPETSRQGNNFGIVGMVIAIVTTLMLPGNDFAESDPEEIQEQLGKRVDLVIHGGFLGQQPTTVVDLTESVPVVVREGTGDVTPFL